MIRRFYQRAIVFPVASIALAWVAFISWRPWYLGFYHDDWSLLTVTSSYGRKLLEGGQTRPLNVAMGYLGVSLFGTNTFAWHLYGAVLVLFTSISVYAACYVITRQVFEANVARVGALVAGIAWMLYPWSLGYSAWPAMFPGLVAVGLFSTAMAILAENPSSASRIRWAGYAIVLSSLIYEAFWFAFLPVALIALAMEAPRAWRNAFRVFVVLGGFQLSLVAWNQLISHWGGGGGKQLNPNWFDIVAYFPVRLVSGWGFSRFVVLVLCAVGAAVLLLMITRASRPQRVVLVLAACIAGISISVALYAAAGYAIVPKGVFSRTSIAVNVWLSLGISVFVALVLSSATSRFFRAVTIVLVLLGLTQLAFENLREANRWTESWRNQREVLRKLPLSALEAIEAKSALVIALPTTSGMTEGLEGYWDTTAALYVTFPSLRDSIESGRLWSTVSKNSEWLTQWDGSRLTQYWCHSPNQLLWEHRADNAYVIDIERQELRGLSRSWVSGCG